MSDFKCPLPVPVSDIKLKLQVLKSKIESEFDEFATIFEGNQENGVRKVERKETTEMKEKPSSRKDHGHDEPGLSSREKNYIMRDSLLTFELMTWCFGKLPIVITMWMLMFLSTIGVLYPGFQYWSYCHKTNALIVFYSSIAGIINSGAVLGYLLYLSVLLILPIKYLFHFDLPIASSFIVICEQIRFFMKVHSFVCENVPRALKWKKKCNHKSDDAIINTDRPCPKLEKFIYFLFAPVLIYRDEYPRTKSINWKYVIKCFAEAFGCILYTYYIISRFCVPIFETFNSEHITLKTFSIVTFHGILPGTFCLLLLFYGLLHAWLNAFAEMLTFGDRLFYKDWWNANSFPAYYRTWNTVIHDWLFIYVFRDVNRIFGGKAAGALSVFFLSAVVHEYMFITAFKFFYPVIFTLYFTFGVVFFFGAQTFRQVPSSNVFFWFNLMHGNGMFMSLYSMEWYARINCHPYYENSFWDYLVPRSLTCITK